MARIASATVRFPAAFFWVPGSRDAFGGYSSHHGMSSSSAIRTLRLFGHTAQMTRLHLAFGDATYTNCRCLQTSLRPSRDGRCFSNRSDVTTHSDFSSRFRHVTSGDLCRAVLDMSPRSTSAAFHPRISQLFGCVAEDLSI
ncbi:hypothetical protein EXIGLDRAFT_779609 [Exidia glandulosa HHB12029]|uniref:Uncharacterized protein n=1 Tax=Exidia glandulosa HHB12029 TaxID=1314781 RepID=A0A165BZK7_EXIGL|nr:hypothetical protein EXIGLDRAFT_779609 [Exidia glandulosa HHB12029]